MYFVLAIAALFIFLSIYFFFSAEKLQREIIIQRREGESTRKENKILVDSLALIANRHEEFTKALLHKKIAQAKLSNNETLAQQFELITPLVNNYSFIFRECLKGNGRLKAVVQKCFNNHNEKSFKQFVALLVTSDKRLKRYWSSNNLNGFLFLVDALINVELDEHSMALADEKKSKTATSETGL